MRTSHEGLKVLASSTIDGAAVPSGWQRWALRDTRLATLALFVALAVLHTWPLATDPAHLSRLDAADGDLNTWVLAWVSHILPRRPLDLFEAPIFYPEPHTLAYSEHMLVPSLMGAPLIWLGASPVAVYNLLVILGLALSGWTMSLVVHRWTGSLAAGVVSGLLYGFNAHVLTRIAHLQAQHVEFVPLVLLALDRLLVRGRTRDAALVAATFVLQSLCSNYTMVFLAVALLASVAVRPGAWCARDRGAVRLRLLVAAAASVLVLGPFLWPYHLVSRDQGLVRSLDEVALYSAGWRDYLSTGGRLHYAWWSHRFFPGSSALFPGVTATILTLVALVSRVGWRDPRARMALGFGVAGFALSFGPGLPGYAWLHTHVPLLNGLRSAVRWGWLLLAAVAMLAGFGVAALERRWGRSRRWPLVAVSIATLVTIEAMRAPMAFTPFTGIPRIYDRLANEPDVVLAEFPFYAGDDVSRNAPYLVFNTRGLQPMLNGYSGFQTTGFAVRGRQLKGFPGPQAVALLRSVGVTHVIVHLDPFVRERGAEALDALERLPALQLVADEDRIRLYRFR